jgi:hypothetical protein
MLLLSRRRFLPPHPLQKLKCMTARFNTNGATLEASSSVSFGATATTCLLHVWIQLSKRRACRPRINTMGVALLSWSISVCFASYRGSLLPFVKWGRSQNPPSKCIFRSRNLGSAQSGHVSSDFPHLIALGCVWEMLNVNLEERCEIFA